MGLKLFYTLLCAAWISATPFEIPSLAQIKQNAEKELLLIHDMHIQQLAHKNTDQAIRNIEANTPILRELHEYFNIVVIDSETLTKRNLTTTIESPPFASKLRLVSELSAKDIRTTILENMVSNHWKVLKLTEIRQFRSDWNELVFKVLITRPRIPLYYLRELRNFKTESISIYAKYFNQSKEVSMMPKNLEMRLVTSATLTSLINVLLDRIRICNRINIKSEIKISSGFKAIFGNWRKKLAYVDDVFRAIKNATGVRLGLIHELVSHLNDIVLELIKMNKKLDHLLDI